MRWTRVAAASVAAVTATAVLGACTGSDGSAGSSVNGAAATEPAVGQAPRGTVDGGTSYSSAGGSSAESASGKRSTATMARLDLGGSKIVHVDMTVAIAHASDVAAAADKAGEIATRYGGEVDGDDRVAGAHAHATVIVRVLPDNLQQALHNLSALGHEQSRSSSTQDVTQQVADVNSRVTSLTAEIATLQGLYERPGQPLDQVLQVEQTLAQRQSDLESLQAQQRALQHETDLATVTLDLVTATKAAVVRHHRDRTGFVGGLQRGWDAFVAGASHVATAAGAVLPFVALLLVLAGAARLAGLKRPRRRPPTPAAE
ncbi:MAG: DUF4349 domain-containing protein [Jatrophihabitans sp.]|uniref:DUF4349 domain-containing protein n=1 Tax=Jatrophihabitans sp. TaxID=1932789 RepID=UPI003F7DBF96